jgi:hypothetical protein
MLNKNHNNKAMPTIMPNLESESDSLYIVHHMTDYVTTYLTSAVRLPSSYIAFFLDFNMANSATMFSKLMLLAKSASMVKSDKSHSLS